MSGKPSFIKLLKLARSGDVNAEASLLTQLRDEYYIYVQRLGLRADGTFQPTMAIHDLYMKMVNLPNDPSSEQAFRQFASKAIKNVVLEWFRRAKAQKRQGGYTLVSLSETFFEAHQPLKMERVSKVLYRLNKIKPEECDVFIMKHIIGMSDKGIAAEFKISTATVQRRDRLARIYFSRTVREAF